MTKSQTPLEAFTSLSEDERKSCIDSRDILAAIAEAIEGRVMEVPFTTNWVAVTNPATVCRVVLGFPP